MCRVFAVSIVISIILHTGGLASILAIICLTLFYTFEGGMTAVIWTDVVQMIMYVAGAAGQLCSFSQADSRRSRARMGHRFRGGQVPHFRFPLVVDISLYVLGGLHRGLLSYHGEPWNRPTRGTAAAQREKSE